MNTIGKILVILNFVFAVVVGAFLVVDFATRSNWKRAHDDIKKELDVVLQSRQTGSNIAGDIINENKALKIELENVKQKLAQTEEDMAAKEATASARVADAQSEAKKADANFRAAQGDVARLNVAVKDLNKVIADREQSVLTLQTDVKKYRNEALAQEENARVANARNVQLQAELTELGKRLAALQLAGTQGAGTPGTAPGTSPSITPRTGTEANPPDRLVKGQVERVEGTLVRLSVGSDDGVAKNNTLEVFRTRPTAEYLGMVRVTETYPTYSVGRLMTQDGAARKQVREGDQVWSWLSR